MSKPESLPSYIPSIIDIVQKLIDDQSIEKIFYRVITKDEFKNLGFLPSYESFTLQGYCDIWAKNIAEMLNKFIIACNAENYYKIGYLFNCYHVLVKVECTYLDDVSAFDGSQVYFQNSFFPDLRIPDGFQDAEIDDATMSLNSGRSNISRVEVADLIMKEVADLVYEECLEQRIDFYKTKRNNFAS